jgi:hypothetical protein
MVGSPVTTGSASVLDSRQLHTYRLLFLIENGLRELVVEELSRKAGARWYKHRLSRDLIEKYEAGLAYERTTRWIELVPHHPMYYLDFPELKKIILRNDNWNDCFKAIFHNQEILTGTLSELEPIRNKVAHHRLVSARDETIVQAAYDKILDAVGKPHWEQLSCRSTLALDINGQFCNLSQIAQQVHDRCTRAEALFNDEGWRPVLDAWWFDAGYLGFSVSHVELFFNIVSAYTQLERHRGDGYKIEQ